jgi:hypothetical protein
MMETTRALNPQRFVPQSDGTFTYTLLGDEGLTTELPDGQPSRPCMKGDILSVQPDGSLQGRPSGANGGYERLRLLGSVASYSPLGVDGPSYILPSGVM